jgi:hypothetical protein
MMTRYADYAHYLGESVAHMQGFSPSRRVDDDSTPRPMMGLAGLAGWRVKQCETGPPLRVAPWHSPSVFVPSSNLLAASPIRRPCRFEQGHRIIHPPKLSASWKRLFLFFLTRTVEEAGPLSLFKKNNKPRARANLDRCGEVPKESRPNNPPASACRSPLTPPPARGNISLSLSSSSSSSSSSQLLVSAVQPPRAHIAAPLSDTTTTNER